LTFLWKHIPRKSEFLIHSLHLFVLVNFAVAQPLFDLLSRHLGYFIAHDLEAPDVFFLILVLSGFFPSFFILCEWIVGLLSLKLSRVLHFIFVACLVLILFLQGAKKIFEGPGIVLIFVSTIAGILFAMGYFRIQGFRMFLTVLTPSVFIFPGFFLYSLSGSPIFFPSKKITGIF